MKNVADSSFQSLPIVDNEQVSLTLARSLAAVDLLLRVVVLAGVATGSLSTLLFGAVCLLPLAATIALWTMERDALLAGFALLAAGVMFAATLGPAVGLIAGIVFWTSCLAGLSAD